MKQDYDQFVKYKKKCTKLTQKTFRDFYSIYKNSLQELLIVKDLLVEEYKKDTSLLFHKVTLILLSRFIQHMESLLVLVEGGLYGDAMVIMRSIISDMKMYQYLQLKPDLVVLFLSESQQEYQKNSKFKAAFNETAIDKVLIENGGRSTKESFEILSKAAHSTSWGAQLYGTAGKDVKKYNLKYSPGFELKKAFTSLTCVAPAFSDFVNMIIVNRRNNNLDLSHPNWLLVIKKAEKSNDLIAKYMSVCSPLINDFDSVIKK